MNDRYLYRAKRTDNGEWVEGMPLFYQDGSITIYGQKQAQTVGFHIQNNGYCDRNTLCQCTGLKDKNGKLIWENDVVEMYDRNTDYRWRAAVTFGNPNGEYTWGWQLKPIGECEANKDILCWIDMEESGAFCDVIGSAIDNPELLEVGE